MSIQIICSFFELGYFCCCSVTRLYLTFCDPMDYSMLGSPVLHCLPEFVQIHVHWVSVMLSNHFLFCPHSLLLLPSVFPSIRVFFKESALHIRWPEYWSFSFSISPSSEYSGLIPLGLTVLISLQSKGLSRVLSRTTIRKDQFFGVQPSFMVQHCICTWLLEKP